MLSAQAHQQMGDNIFPSARGLDFARRAAEVVSRLHVRVRITKRLTGSIDGIQLGRFKPGGIYDVTTSLATYLLCERMAEPIADDSPALVVPLEQQGFERRDTARAVEKQPTNAADRQHRPDRDPSLT